MLKFMRMLNNISRSQAVFRQRRVSAPDLSPTHYAFVLAVCREPGRSQEELAQELCLNKSTVARSMTYLEEQGYVLRQPSPADRRQLSVYPKEKMLAVLPALRAASAEWREQVSLGIPEDELAVFYSVLERMEARARELSSGQEADE